MRAVTVVEGGLEWREHPDPEPGAGELLVEVRAAGLNSAEVEGATKLIHQLAAEGITIVMIEHLMKVVLNVCTRIAVLHNGRLLARGTREEIRANSTVRDVYLGHAYA